MDAEGFMAMSSKEVPLFGKEVPLLDHTQQGGNRPLIYSV
jgi:hypothetical protein